MPCIEAVPQEKPEGSSSRGGRHRNSLRDFMLKNPDDSSHNSPSVAPRDMDPSSPGGQSVPTSPFHHWTPFSRVRHVHINFKSKAAFPQVQGDLGGPVGESVNINSRNMICITIKVTSFL